MINETDDPCTAVNGPFVIPHCDKIFFLSDPLLDVTKACPNKPAAERYIKVYYTTSVKRTDEYHFGWILANQTVSYFPTAQCRDRTGMTSLRNALLPDARVVLWEPAARLTACAQQLSVLLGADRLQPARAWLATQS